MLKPDWADILKYILVIKDIPDPISSFKNKPMIVNKLNELNWKKHFPAEDEEPPRLEDPAPESANLAPDNDASESTSEAPSN